MHQNPKYERWINTLLTHYGVKMRWKSTVKLDMLKFVEPKEHAFCFAFIIICEQWLIK